MATTVSLAATEQEAAQLNIASRTSGDVINGTLHSCDTSIAIGGSETTGDYITVAYLPAGAVIIPRLCRIGFLTDDQATGKLIYTNAAGTEVDIIAAHTTVASGGGSHLGAAVTLPPNATGQYKIQFKLTGGWTGSPPAATPLYFGITYKHN